MPLILLRSITVLTIAALATPGAAVAQDTLSITGTLKMNKLYPTVGDDLADVFAHGNDHWWRLTCSGVTLSYDQIFYMDEYGGYFRQYITRVHAASIGFEFFGPDAAILNEVVSRQLATGGATDGAVLELTNVDYFDAYNWDAGQYPTWEIALAPEDAAGVRFTTANESVYLFGGDNLFAADGNGYPIVSSRRLYAYESEIQDFRNSNTGSLASFDDIVVIGSDQNPLPPLQLDIQDASVREGDKGTIILQMTVTLNRASNQIATVNYRTADVTASAGTDYVAASGTLTFQPGQTTRTIALSIKGDHKREPNETFTVRLSNAVGAVLGRSIGTVTIVNDD